MKRIVKLGFIGMLLLATASVASAQDTTKGGTCNPDVYHRFSFTTPSSVTFSGWPDFQATLYYNNYASTFLMVLFDSDSDVVASSAGYTRFAQIRVGLLPNERYELWVGCVTTSAAFRLLATIGNETHSSPTVHPARYPVAPSMANEQLMILDLEAEMMRRLSDLPFAEAEKAQRAEKKPKSRTPAPTQGVGAQGPITGVPLTWLGQIPSMIPGPFRRIASLSVRAFVPESTRTAPVFAPPARKLEIRIALKRPHRPRYGHSGSGGCEGTAPVAFVQPAKGGAGIPAQEPISGPCTSTHGSVRAGFSRWRRGGSRSRARPTDGRLLNAPRRAIGWC